jgi:hypothetical protein
LIVDGVVTLNNTATGQTPAANDNSTKLATTAWVQNYVVPYSLPKASATILGGIKVGTGLAIDGAGVLSVTAGGGSSSSFFKEEQTFTATAGQTTFTFVDGYTPGYVDVFLNGVLLSKTEYTATNGTTVVLTDSCLLSDIVTIISYSPYVVGQTAAAKNVCRLTATEGQTSFACNYAVGQVDVFYNGSKLDISEFTAIDGTNIVLGSAAVVGDKIEIVTWLVGNGVAATTTITINGVTYDLSTNRTWTVLGTLPTGGNAGQLLSKVDGSNYNVQWIDEAPAASYTSQLKHRVKSSQVITKGQAVYVSSADGTNMIISKASNASEGTSSKTMGLLESTVAINGTANVITEGLLTGLDTTGANAAGDPVWLGTDGNLIYGLANKPVAPAHLVFIGVVTRRNANNGEIFVKVQNGFEMGELHDYVQNGVQNNDVISYESSTSLYKPKSIASLLGYTPANPANYLALTGGTLTGALSGTNARFFGSQAYFAEVSADSSGGFLQAYDISTSRYQPYLIYGGSNTTGFSLITLNNLGASFSKSIAIGTSSAPNYPLDLLTSSAGTFNTIAQFQNTDYTSGNRTFIRVRQWLTAGGSSSSYFGTGQDGNLYVIANNSARGGDLIINASTGYIGLGTSNAVSKLDINGGSIRLGEFLNSASSLIGKQRSATGTFYSSVEFYSTTGEDVIIFNTHLSGVSAGERVRITGSGNVGIGTTSPNKSLEVLNTAEQLRLSYASNTYTDFRTDSAGGLLINAAVGNYIIHYLGGSEKLRLNTTGLGVGTNDPAVKLDINGAMGLRGTNYFYFGHTTGSIGGWTTRMYANGSEHRFNANSFLFTNEGYGSAVWLQINSSGNAIFSGTITSTGSISTGASLFSTRNILAGDPTPLHLNYASSDGVGPAVRLGSGANGFWDIQPSNNNQRISFEWSDSTNVLNLLSTGRVGINTTTPGYTLDVAGPAKIGNSIYNLASIPDQGNTNSYMHIKTNLYMGGAGNTMHIMGGFRFKGYHYSSNGWGEGTVAFHNWSGSFYNLTVQNTGFAGFVRSPYVSSDGYAVFVVSNETYCGVIVDYFQTVYTFRYPVVTSYTTSNSASGVY